MPRKLTGEFTHEVIRVNLHRPHEEVVKTVSVKREADKWYVILSCDLGDVVVEPNGLPEIGVDVGLEHFLTTSDGEHVANPRFLKNELTEVRRKPGLDGAGGSQALRRVFPRRCYHLGCVVSPSRCTIKDTHHVTVV